MTGGCQKLRGVYYSVTHIRSYLRTISVEIQRERERERERKRERKRERGGRGNKLL